MILSNRIGRLSESLTIAISSKAKELKAQGKDVVIFSAGEPDFDTAEVSKKAVIGAMEKGCGNLRRSLFRSWNNKREKLYFTVAPKGIRASFASLKHCFPKGIPTIVMQ